jgi:hypothetical protein
MRLRVVIALLTAVLPAARAEKLPFLEDRFSVEIPAEWKKAEGPEDGHLLYREAPGADGSFSVFRLRVAKDHRADLEATFRSRARTLVAAGMEPDGESSIQEQPFDGKPAVFGVIPVKTDFAGEEVKFSYYLVLIDAGDMVIIMQATLPRPADKELREATLGIIQSFREADPGEPGPEER